MQLNQSKTGMATQTQSMMKFLKANAISKEDAIRYSTQPQELINNIGV
jgi:twitching motility protein PilT